jgi:hypothetical protein
MVMVPGVVSKTCLTLFWGLEMCVYMGGGWGFGDGHVACEPFWELVLGMQDSGGAGQFWSVVEKGCCSCCRTSVQVGGGFRVCADLMHATQVILLSAMYIV